MKANDYVQGASGSVQNLNLNAGMLDIATGATALSSVASGLASAVGGMPTTDLLFTTPGGVLTPNAGTSVSIAASGAFSVDQTLVVPNALLLTCRGQPDDRIDRLAVLVERQRDAGGWFDLRQQRGSRALFQPRTAAG